MALPGKLWKLKEWLTVPEAARHLSIMFGEEVSEADVLRLALDGHLKLSVNFVNGASARRGGKFLPFEEWEKKFRDNNLWEDLKPIAFKDKKLGFHFSGHEGAFLPPNAPIITEPAADLLRPEELKNDYLKECSPEQQAAILCGAIEAVVGFTRKQSEKFGGKVPPNIMNFKENISSIRGIYDLPMLGGEQLDIEHEYQRLTDGPSVTLQSWDGAFVEGPDGEVCWLQEEFDKEFLENQFGEEGIKRSVDYYAECLKKRISDNEIDEAEAEKLLEQRKQNLSRKRDPSSNYFPAGGLPDDSVIVVRTSALTDLQVRLEKESEEEVNGKATVKDDIGRKERPTWLKIIYLLAMKIAQKNKAAFLSKGTLNSVAFEKLMKIIARELEMVSSLDTEDQSEQIKNITYGMSDSTLSNLFNEGEKIISKYFE